MKKAFRPGHTSFHSPWPSSTWTCSGPSMSSCSVATLNCSVTLRILTLFIGIYLCMQILGNHDVLEASIRLGTKNGGQGRASAAGKADESDREKAESARGFVQRLTETVSHLYDKDLYRFLYYHFLFVYWKICPNIRKTLWKMHINVFFILWLIASFNNKNWGYKNFFETKTKSRKCISYHPLPYKNRKFINLCAARFIILITKKSFQE